MRFIDKCFKTLQSTEWLIVMNQKFKITLRFTYTHQFLFKNYVPIQLQNGIKIRLQRQTQND